MGSGDMFSPMDVKMFLRSTKAAGAIIARGAIHYPAIFAHKTFIIDRDSPLVDYRVCLENINAPTVSNEPELASL